MISHYYWKIALGHKQKKGYTTCKTQLQISNYSFAPKSRNRGGIGEDNAYVETSLPTVSHSYDEDTVKSDYELTNTVSGDTRSLKCSHDFQQGNRKGFPGKRISHFLLE